MTEVLHQQLPEETAEGHGTRLLHVRGTAQQLHQAVTGTLKQPEGQPYDKTG